MGLGYPPFCAFRLPRRAKRLSDNIVAALARAPARPVNTLLGFRNWNRTNRERLRDLVGGMIFRRATNFLLDLIFSQHAPGVTLHAGDYLYRYRPAHALLSKFRELENEEIYFSTTAELNDPMEGFKNLFWSGDEVVWRNLLRHYAYVLLNTTYLAFVAGEQFKPSDMENIIMGTPGHLPDAPIREIYKRVSDQFLSNEAVSSLVADLAARKEPVRRDELRGYLRGLHPFALNPIFNDLHARGLWPGFVPLSQGWEEKSKRDFGNFITLTRRLRKNSKLRRISDVAFAVGEAMSDQLLLIHEINLKDRAGKGPLTYLAGRFSNAYLAALDKLIHQDWYVACFSPRPDDHAMWTTYADGHHGACLIFKAVANERGRPSLSVNRLVGMGAPGNHKTYAFQRHEFEAVRYSRKFIEIDFFRSLGAIRQIDLVNFWYRNHTDNTFSDCYEDFRGNESAWRDKYWRVFRESCLCKTPEWSHEGEFRLVAHSFFDLSKQDDRKMKFKFEELAGIVFGARMSLDDRLEIMKIIEQKCLAAGRTDFIFREARYSLDEGFRIYDLPLLKIAKATPR